MKCALVPADKAANNVAIVWRFHYINTLTQEVGGTKTRECPSTDEKTIVVDNRYKVKRTSKTFGVILVTLTSHKTV